MAIRMIRGEADEILKKRSREVEVIDDKIKELVQDMIETLHKNNGVGLAAVQVGVLKRIVIIDLYEENVSPMVLINPCIIAQTGEHEVTEGCLSFPNKFARIIRPKEVEARYVNINGKKEKLKCKDLLAQIIAHEIDHLNGEVFIDKILPGTLEVITEKENEKKGD
jgi:peptide deformylase